MHLSPRAIRLVQGKWKGHLHLLRDLRLTRLEGLGATVGTPQEPKRIRNRNHIAPRVPPLLYPPIYRQCPRDYAARHWPGTIKIAGHLLLSQLPTDWNERYDTIAEVIALSIMVFVEKTGWKVGKRSSYSWAFSMDVRALSLRRWARKIG